MATRRDRQSVRHGVDGFGRPPGPRRAAWSIGVAGALLVQLSAASAQTGLAPSPAGTPAEPEPRSSYEVRFDEEDRRSVRVRARLFTNDTLLQFYGDNYDAGHLPDGWATFVRGLEVRDEAGRPLSLERAGPNGWRMPSDRTGAVHVDYELLVHHDQGHWPVGWDEAAYANRECDCIFLTGMSLFIGAADLSNIEVALDLPGASGNRPAWDAATPWDAAPGGRHRYRIADFRHLSEVGFVVGRFPAAEVSAGETRVRLAIGAAIPDGIALFSDAARAYLAALDGVFGGTAPGTFLVVANTDVFTGGGAFLGTASLLFKEPPQRDDRAAWGHILAHELAHLWNGHALEWSADEEWFKEGVTDYVARRVQLGAGDFDADGFLAAIARSRGWYPTDDVVALRTAGSDKSRWGNLLYSGGLLAGFALDVELRRGSDLAHGLPDLLRALWQERAGGRRTVREADLRRVAIRLAGDGMSAFFDRHIGSAEPVPLDAYAEALGYRLVRGGPEAGATFSFEPLPAPTTSQLALRRALFDAAR